MKRFSFVLAAFLCATFVNSTIVIAGGDEIGCMVPPDPIPVPTITGEVRSVEARADLSVPPTSSPFMKAVGARLTARIESAKENPARAAKRVARVLTNHPELIPTVALGGDQEMSPASGWTQSCKRVYSYASDEYCNTKTGQLCWRSSSVDAADCWRYWWDTWGEYTARTTILSRSALDCHSGGGTIESLRGRFYVGEDGSVVLRPKDGSVLYFDPDPAPCAEAGDSTYRSLSKYRDYYSSIHSVPASSNVTHGEITGQPWVRINDDNGSETLWEGAEVCWQ